jgi:hypothetical protein
MTILQGFKKSLLPLDARDWKDTIEDTAKSLAREPSDMRDELYGELIRTGNELARKSGDVEVRKNFTLSKSACIENSRAAGGFAGHFLAEMGCRDVVYRISPPILVGDIRYHDSSRVGLLYSRCPYQYADLYNELGKFALYERMEEGIAQVQMRVIPEPFKFRVISVGEFDYYSYLKPWQTWMWKTLQKFECFSLTGAGADDLVSHVEKIVTRYWDVGRKFLSGDYKAATNELSSFASMVLAEAWFKNYPEYLTVLKKSLFSSELLFDKASLGVPGLMPPKKVPKELRRSRDREIYDAFCNDQECPTFWQEDEALMNNQIEASLPECGEMNNGQLMGHPCSFPILCAVNAAVCRMSLEKVWDRRFSLDDIPLLVNGDDCLLIGPNDLLPVWRELTSECGLIESVGKSYFSDRFAMINSRYLSIETAAVYSDDRGYLGEAMLDKSFVKKDQEQCPIRYVASVKHDVGYVNLGVLVGRKKGSNVDCEVNIADEVNDSTAYAFWQSAADNFEQMNLRCKKLSVNLGRYVSSFQRFFSKIPLPLHLNKEMGGFGLPGADVTSVARLRSPFKQSRQGSCVLGEAYFSGGMASVFDDGLYPDFLERAKWVGRRLRGKVIPSAECRHFQLVFPDWNVIYDPWGRSSKKLQEPESQWTVTTCGRTVSLSGGEDEDSPQGESTVEWFSDGEYISSRSESEIDCIYACRDLVKQSAQGFWAAFDSCRYDCVD